MTYSRLQSDRKFVETSMPKNSRELKVNGVTGWSFEITCFSTLTAPDTKLTA